MYSAEVGGKCPWFSTIPSRVVPGDFDWDVAHDVVIAAEPIYSVMSHYDDATDEVFTCCGWALVN